MTDARPDPDEPDPDHDEVDALLSRVRVVEERPLRARAPGYASIHDALQRRLEGDSRSSV